MNKKTVVIFSGAGLSAESGIPTFRDSNGLWENHKVEDVASQDGWVRDKSLVLNFYQQRFANIKSCSPNLAHTSIARLQEKYNVVNITQNIDDLLERAGCLHVTHLHGCINSRKCEKHHDISNLDGDTNFTCDYKTIAIKAPVLGETCEKCGGQMRPDVVWFGEAVDLNYTWIKELCREVKYNDGVFICVGTSAQVHPAASLIPLFSQVKNKYIIDKKPIKVADYTLLAGSASEKLAELANQLLSV